MIRRSTVLVLLLLAACTNADPEGSLGSPTGPSPSSPTPSTPAANVTALENDVVALVNQQRAQGARCGLVNVMPPVGPVTMHETLRRVARAHSEDMQTRRFYSHTNPEGDGPLQRLQKAGYAASSVGENIAVGATTARAVMQMWMDSPDHCGNLMSRFWTRIGVGYAPPSNYWTQVFTTN